MNRTLIAIIALVIISILYFMFSKADLALSKGKNTLEQKTEIQSEQTAKDLMQDSNTTPTSDLNQ